MLRTTNGKSVLVGLVYALFGLYWVFKATSTGDTWNWVVAGCLLAVGASRVVLAYRERAVPDEDQPA